MEELQIKKDFTEIYVKKYPAPYLSEMRNLEYRIPDQTKPLYQHLAERMVNYLKRPIKILDIGSSYGINSALLNYELVMSELDDFFENHPQSSIIEVQDFFDSLPNKNPNFQFYLVDTSLPALEFAEKVGLCEGSFCINMEKEKVSFEFKQILKDIDLIISTGCIGYIGSKSFEKIFSSLDKDNKYSIPVFAFTVLRIFPTDEIDNVFRKNNFELIKTKIGPLKQRRFYNNSEMKKSLELLKQRGISTAGLEEEGYYCADLFVGGPSTHKSVWLGWVQNLEDVFVPIQGQFNGGNHN